ncbi:bacteriochlorophyll 4-vinyl reductase [Rhodoferax sp. 4810]|uniref:Bacteriochlorophyll 4-vinyl reductase n=2 Tax=Thiospirillum jenense TaxID=1653858 RepID=A0A839HFF9_9GAMM|nr:bacteriochlorophyll 4-vinyl reductase [Thiospirillum jenense]MBB1073387.1 bacteriochlorophyll 4-vinyl reductase [Rhodoferax jenense]MBB1125739.1 bacteriochlorophyll 4-vinyl reductase [Thiospirillum jenense]
MHTSNTTDIPRIGPNAIIRVAEALTAQYNNPELTAQIFTTAGLTHYLTALPTQMVPETEVTALAAALRQHLDADAARAVSHDAGQRTGDYLLAHRIPKPAQRVLRLLPPALACRMLLKAIEKNAWTFVGSGHYHFNLRRPVQITIAHCPLCRDATAPQPICDFYVGAFERLCQTLVSRRTQVTEIACQAAGAPACVFELRW